MTKYEAIHTVQQRLKQTATPAQKRREFKRQQFIAKKVAGQTLFVSVLGVIRAYLACFVERAS